MNQDEEDASHLSSPPLLATLRLSYRLITRPSTAYTEAVDAASSSPWLILWFFAIALASSLPSEFGTIASVGWAAVRALLSYFVLYWVLDGAVRFFGGASRPVELRWLWLLVLLPGGALSLAFYGAFWLDAPYVGLAFVVPFLWL